MSREEPLHVHVENRSDDVLCPECNEKMRKEDLSDIDRCPTYPSPANGWTGAMGKAFCVQRRLSSVRGAKFRETGRIERVV